METVGIEPTGPRSEVWTLQPYRPHTTGSRWMEPEGTRKICRVRQIVSFVSGCVVTLRRSHTPSIALSLTMECDSFASGKKLYTDNCVFRG